MNPNVSIVESEKLFYQPHRTAEISAYVGHFERGPIDYPIWITDVNQFKLIFGRGIDVHTQDWYQVYNYLQYVSGIWVIRTSSKDSTNASSHNLPYRINLYQDWLDIQSEDLLLGNPFTFIAKTTGEWANTLTIITITKNDWDNNSELFNGVLAKNVFSYFEDDYIGIVIFKSDELVETYYKTINELLSDNAVNSGNYVYMSIDKNVVISDFSLNHYKLSGGASLIPLESEISNSYDLLLDDMKYSLDSIIGNELFNYEAIRIAQTRKDCIAYIGMPTELVEFLEVHVNGEHRHVYSQSGDIVVREVNKHNRLTSESITKIENYIKTLSYSDYVHFTLNVKMQKDLFTDKVILVNVAGDIAGLKAQSSLLNPWNPSCGLVRGKIKNAIDMKFKLNRKLIDHFYSLGCNYTSGIYLMSQRTFQGTQRSNKNIHVQNVINHVKKEVNRILNEFIFIDNNYSTRYNVSYRIKEYLEDIRLHRGIRGGKVFASEGPKNSIKVDVTIYPVDTIEQIKLQFHN